MARRFIFTEKQLKRILGEDFEAYLVNADHASAADEQSIPYNYGEIKPTDTGGSFPITTDKVGGTKIPMYPWLRMAYNPLYEQKKKVHYNDEGKKVPETCPKCGAKVMTKISGEPVFVCSNKECGEFFGVVPFSGNKLEERNQYLDDKRFRLAKNTNKVVSDAAKDGSDKMMNHMAANKNIRLKTLYTRRYRLNRMRTEDPERFKRINGEKILKDISDTIERAKGMGKALANSAVKPIKPVPPARPAKAVQPTTNTNKC
jgi:hypothetical protein